ncbi:hypothetical protein M441DRAFT_455204 [Trichoderma asperellum CBS 433.97]|uniref:Uncharacterized protein n=1 Tax=Trichoderma asperellum (strain ATCC 204424 / CBS 433.97 / NBRC 101777) TaxID=1042311 RepID=A0A2T3ZEP7_TRIA4|nr:hypothetical protein M441DRAFT_455204 [Trichoderma asperellum CBS 433.97]PTB43287.1 hypothetical protein M441DRAFT_455204 [Trichoderma asperellum CBS 433.97]
MNWGWAEDAWLPKWVVLQAPVELKKTCSTRATHRLPSSTGTFDCYVSWAEVPPEKPRAGLWAAFSLCGVHRVIRPLFFGIFLHLCLFASAQVTPPGETPTFSVWRGICTSTSLVGSMMPEIISRDQAIVEAGSSISRRLALSEISAHNARCPVRGTHFCWVADMVLVGSSRSGCGNICHAYPV